ncbi:hypothetical protein [Georgenia thermotolerans]|uniref:Uncharacterized protein n=1 Tax=Georgenia thermotolerans TaxID=527326 RepID=A0A7J5UIS0_9MICO|nr:hypothetical protein [Georgenia thermotolerans]KAE8762268.1 hypothetical protein GB883_20225 [Georgenia thermotolerans]
MTATTVAPSARALEDPLAQALERLRDALRELLQSAIRYAVVKIAGKVGEVIEDLDLGVVPKGVLGGALVEGVQAFAAGKSPVWAAARGAWEGAETKTKVLVVLAVVLLVLLLPVVLVLLLLGLLVAGIVAAIRAATR